MGGKPMAKPSPGRLTVPPEVAQRVIEGGRQAVPGRYYVGRWS